MDDEQKAQQAKQVIQDAKRVRAFRDMIASDGWKYYQELLNGKILDKTATIFERPQSGDGVRGEDWDKGTVFAWITARDLPEVIINVSKQQNSEPATEDD